MFDSISEALVSLLIKILEIFPESPFVVIDSIETSSLANFSVIMSYINWFIPVGSFVKIFGVWLSAVAVYYIYQIALRWAKMIE